MSTPFLGQLTLVAFNYPPKGYAFCDGQLLPIAQNQALYALVGNTFGGDGRTTFALPDLRGRVAISSGSSYTLGSVVGSESVTLQITQIPAHTHTLTVSNAGTSPVPALSGNTVGTTATTTPNTPYAASSNDVMASTAITMAGNSQPHENRSPFLVLSWVIALTGIFPSRN